MHSILQVLPSEACYSVPCFLVGVDVWLEVVIDRQTYTILFDTGIILLSYVSTSGTVHLSCIDR